MRHAVASYREMRSKGDRSLRSLGLIRPEVEARLDECTWLELSYDPIHETPQ